MTRHDDSQLVPVRVFSAGAAEAVVWQLYDVVRRRVCIPYYGISLHRSEQSTRGASHTTIVLLAPDGVSGTIQALQKVHRFLSHPQIQTFGALSMFDSGLDRLEAMATR